MNDVQLPAKLLQLAKQQNAATWIRQLPELIERVADTWELQVLDPYPDSTVSFVAPCMQGGKLVVLKIQWPHPECMFEADALEAWQGQGAVRLLDHDRQSSAMLLEH